ncbi:unnamed protein product [Ceutorhynchus assimilis]|uniref:non-specific serine/threonine protein kinase n=1 Tax=Ceutorhynchus assimilis TaxID=467358 RepID=A0A9N9QJ95_9CUCU|nr:unnamed protein product [Ceutorhynchus assimilis]
MQPATEESDCHTPKKQILHSIKIPASPYMKRIGFGTGIAVYELERSPAFNKFRSPWALKKLLKRTRKDTAKNTELQKRLNYEAEILRKLDHPNIVGFRAFVEKKDGNILAMEECSFCLGDLIEKRQEDEKGPFDAKILKKVCLDVAKAISYLHNTALLMHCDLKSYNVLIKNDFEKCKLCDFGVCLPITADGNLDLNKAPRAKFCGTKCWYAPEVLRDPQIITTKADIYSFGLMIWEMIALCPPIFEDMIEDIKKTSEMDEEKLDELLAKEGFRKRPPIPADVDLGEEYKHILEIYYRCTCEDMKDRPLASDLEVILNDIFYKK